MQIFPLMIPMTIKILIFTFILTFSITLFDYYFRSASFKEDEGTWKGNDDGKVVNNQPQRVMDDRNGLGPQGGYIAKYIPFNSSLHNIKNIS